MTVALAPSGLPSILCADYGVAIVDRRTRATVARMPEVGWELTYDYRIDRTSEATLVVDVGPGGVGDDCCSMLGRVGHWMHELVVYRQGNNREVWGGPIVKLRDSPGRGQFTVMARDRSAWWWRRAIPVDLIYSGTSRTDAARVFMDLLRAAEQNGGPASWRLPYDPVRLNVEGRETGVVIDGKVLTASDIVIVGPEIQTLADSVIDWTVIGRRCYVGSLVIELAPLPILAQDHWLELDPEIEWDGDNVATQVQVLGARGIRGEWPPGRIDHPRWPQYGSHTMRVSDGRIADQATATERARTLWELNQQPTLCVLSSGGSLGPNAPVTPEDLIPGRMTRVGFDTSCFVTGTRLAQTRVNGVLQYVAYDGGVARDLVVPQRITRTTVNVIDSKEVAVLVDLQPPGTDVRRRPGGRSDRQPGHDPTEPPDPGCCAVEYWDSDNASIGGDTVEAASGDILEPHDGSCRGDFVRLRGVGDYVQWVWTLTSACFNTTEFRIHGQQFTDGVPMALGLTINGNTYSLENDYDGLNLWSFPTAQEGDPDAWNIDRYNSDQIGTDAPFVVGANTVRLEVFSMGDADYAEIEYVAFGLYGEASHPCLTGLPPCLACADCFNPIFAT